MFKLEPKESYLLSILMEKVDQPVSVEEIQRKVWPGKKYITSNRVFTLVYHLRKRLREEGSSSWIETPNRRHGIYVLHREKHVKSKK